MINESKLRNTRVFLGLDGFVDEVLHVVDERYDENNYKRQEYLSEYGNRIVKSTGLSMNVEMVPIRKKIGGNGVILANSLKQCGVNVTYLGCCGEDTLNPVFKEFGENMKVISVGEPAFTDAIEFNDGKIISSKLDNLKAVSWNNITNRLKKDDLVEIIEQSDLCGFENWTMLMNMTDIWRHLLAEIMPRVNQSKERILFIDLADPTKRSKEDVLEAMSFLRKFEKYFKVNLGLNRKEATLIAGYLGVRSDEQDVCVIAEAIREVIGISSVIIHTAACVWAVEKKGDSSSLESQSNGEDYIKFTTECPICEKPLQTTGAGDNFNAGVIMGRLQELSLEDCVRLGISNAGYYIRNAKSADAKELSAYLDN